MTKSKRLAAREMKLVAELQANHDWVFIDLPKSQRHTMYFKRTVINGKATQLIAPARKVIAAFPATSAVALAIEANATGRTTAPTKRKRGAK